MYAFNTAAIFSPGYPYIEIMSTTVFSDNFLERPCRAQGEERPIPSKCKYPSTFEDHTYQPSRDPRIIQRFECISRVPGNKTKIQGIVVFLHFDSFRCFLNGIVFISVT